MGEGFFDLGHDPDHCDHHCTYFFYQTAHNINVPMIYTLATFFISRYTKGYGWGIVSSLLSVILLTGDLHSHTLRLIS